MSDYDNQNYEEQQPMVNAEPAPMVYAEPVQQNYALPDYVIEEHTVIETTVIHDHEEETSSESKPLLTQGIVIFFALAPLLFIGLIGIAILFGLIPNTIAVTILATLCCFLSCFFWTSILCTCQLRACNAACNWSPDQAKLCSFGAAIVVCFSIIFIVAGPYCISLALGDFFYIRNSIDSTKLFSLSEARTAFNAKLAANFNPVVPRNTYAAMRQSSMYGYYLIYSAIPLSASNSDADISQVFGVIDSERFNQIPNIGTLSSRFSTTSDAPIALRAVACNLLSVGTQNAVTDARANLAKAGITVRNPVCAVPWKPTPTYVARLVVGVIFCVLGGLNLIIMALILIVKKCCMN